MTTLLSRDHRRDWEWASLPNAASAWLISAATRQGAQAADAVLTREDSRPDCPEPTRSISNHLYFLL